LKEPFYGLFRRERPLLRSCLRRNHRDMRRHQCRSLLRPPASWKCRSRPLLRRGYRTFVSRTITKRAARWLNLHQTPDQDHHVHAAGQGRTQHKRPPMPLDATGLHLSVRKRSV